MRASPAPRPARPWYGYVLSLLLGTAAFGVPLFLQPAYAPVSISAVFFAGAYLVAGFVPGFLWLAGVRGWRGWWLWILLPPALLFTVFVLLGGAVSAFFRSDVPLLAAAALGAVAGGGVGARLRGQGG